MTDRYTELNETARPRRRGLLAGAVIAVIVVLAFGSRSLGLLGGNAEAAPGGGGGPGEMPPMPVDVDVARVGEVIDAVSATGRIEAVQAVELRSDEPGRVLALRFREGQRVAAGTPLVQIDNALLEAQAARAAAERDLAEQQLSRVERLRAENAASPADLERVQAAARSAAAALAVLELQIARTTVRAPFAGSVGQRFVSVGDYVTTATPLLTIQTTDPQRAVIEVPERYAGDLQVGQEVEFMVASEPGRTFTAHVEFIDPVVQPETRMIVVKARAPNREGLLKAGMFVDARLAIATREGAIIVPEDAVQPLRTANVVWAVVDGKASRRVVQLGTRSTGVVEILSGVAAGEQVVVGGLERMAEGMLVAPMPRGAVTDSAVPAAAGAPPVDSAAGH